MQVFCSEAHCYYLYICYICLSITCNGNTVHYSKKHSMGLKYSIPNKIWYPNKVLNSTLCDQCYGILILNRPIKMDESVLTPLWKNAKIKCTVDKGTDQWISFLNKNNLDLSTYKPDLVTGDFDSVKQSSIDLFSKLGTTIVSTPDQNFTDFQKAVNEMKDRVHIDYLVVIVEHSGRLDHSLSNINTLYTHSLPIYLLGQKSIAWLLRENIKHTVCLTEDFTKGKKTVALIPIGKPCHNVVTTGLKWNLDNHSLAFGGMVSSSNTYQSEDTNEVTIQMNGDLLWIMQLPNSEQSVR